MSQSSTRSLSAAAIVLERMAAHGIDTLFCLPGVQNDPFFNALFDMAGRIKPIHTRHEQGAACMALGAAMVTGKPAAYCVVPGPGFLNTTAALSNAYGNGAPVLAVTGQVPLAYVNRDTGFLHDIPDQLGILQRLTKWAARISAPHQALGVIDEAFRQMTSGRIRPVGIECPLDVWGKETAIALPSLPSPLPAPAPDDAQIEAAAKLLGAAERPMLIVGGGAMEAGAEILQLAELLDAPVMAYRMGHGVIDGRHPLAVNLPTGHRFWADADVALGIGSRLHTQYTGWGVDDQIKIVRVEIDAEEMVRHRPPTLGLLGDAAPTVKRLIAALAKHNRKRPGRREAVAKVKAEVTADIRRTLQPQVAYLDAIRAELPDNGVFVDEFTQVGYASRLALPVYGPRTYLGLGYQGALGIGYPIALGAKAARPDLPVVSVNGDGGFMFNVAEMATAMQFGIGVVAIVFNDNAYGNVRRMQKEDYGNRLIASDLRNPDFVKLAESHGMAASRVRSPEDLRPALRQALAAGKPALIEVPVAEMPAPWKYIQLPRNRPARKA